MNRIKKVSDNIFDVFEVYLPMIAFVILFLSYIIIIAYRYIFHASISWLNELNIIVFLWGCILAASHGSRDGSHVGFTVLYDKVSGATKLIFRIIGNLFIIVMFFILLPNAYKSVMFMEIKKTPIMKLPFNLIFFPFIIFVVLTIIHHIIQLIEDIMPNKNLSKGKKEK